MQPDSAACVLLSAAAKVQTYTSVGQPSEARKLGAEIVNRHAADLRKLSES